MSEAGRKSAKSAGSRTSISVTLPATTNEPPSLASPRRQTPDAALHVRSSKIGPDAGSPEAARRYITSPVRQKQGTLSHPSSGTVAPVGTPAPRHLSESQRTQILAARIIERAWLSYRDQQMFRLLKHAVCAAEHSVTQSILRKVCPREAEFLKDKTHHIRIRFRFGGSEFPPMIYFKIFSSTSDGMAVRYLSGKKMIQPASEAARDACELMGNRKFYELVIQDIIHQESHSITEETDITTLKDYMQYLSVLDETPASKGGKDNTWRKLTLDVLQRQSMFYDVLDFLYNRQLSSQLRKELPVLMSKPVTQELQRKQIELIAKSREYVPPPTAKSKFATTAQVSARRSRQAKLRALKMRQTYASQKGSTADATDMQVDPYASEKNAALIEEFGFGDGGDNWEEEADRLYEWTQGLSLDEVIATPRLTTANY